MPAVGLSRIVEAQNLYQAWRSKRIDVSQCPASFYEIGDGVTVSYGVRKLRQGVQIPDTFGKTFSVGRLPP